MGRRPRTGNHITFAGLKNLYGDDVKRAALACLKSNAELLRDEMKKRAPVGDPATDKHSGKLKNSIRIESESGGKKMLVGTDVGYSRLTEFDPRQLERHPAWAYPSMDALKKQMIENMRDAIRKAVLKNGGG